MTENTATSGGGLYAIACGAGGALRFGMMNDTVAGNTPSTGGGAGLFGQNGGALSATVVNSIFSGNFARTAPEIHLPQTGGGKAVVRSSFSVIRSRLVASGTFVWGAGMRSDTPVFRDAAKSDFHLKADSRCIDRGAAVGAPATDFEGHRRPQGRAVDIGADAAVRSAYPRLRLLTLTGGEGIPGGRPYDMSWGGSRATDPVPDLPLDRRGPDLVAQGHADRREPALHVNSAAAGQESHFLPRQGPGS